MRWLIVESGAYRADSIDRFEIDARDLAIHFKADPVPPVPVSLAFLSASKAQDAMRAIIDWLTADGADDPVFSLIPKRDTEGDE